LSNECVLANYSFVKSDDGEKDLALVVEVRLNNIMAERLSNNEKYQVLENAMKVIINTVPAEEDMVKNKDTGQLELDFKKMNRKFWKESNFFQPHELLGCHCIAEFVMCNHSLLN
jgi:hypothetical protein